MTHVDVHFCLWQSPRVSDLEPTLEGSTRRAFVAALLVFGVNASLGCASKKAGKTEEPESANAQLGSALKDIDGRIKDVIPDKERRKAAQAIADRGKKMIFELTTILGGWRDAIRLLSNEDKHDRSKVDAVTATYNQKLKDALVETCKLGIELREHVTREEWPKLFPPPTAPDPGETARILLGGVPC